MKKFKRIFISTIVFMALFGFTSGLTTYAQAETELRNQRKQYEELQQLTDGEANILAEFSKGLSANENKVKKDGEYYNGGEIFRYKSGALKNLMLLFENYTEEANERHLSGIAAVTGNFFGVKIGEDSLQKVAGFLGAPDVFEEESDMSGLPFIVYYYPQGTLVFSANHNKIITEASFGVKDNRNILRTREALTRSNYKNAELLNIPLLRDLSKTDIIPPKAYFDLKWPVSREHMAYIAVNLYEYITFESVSEIMGNPYNDELSEVVKKALSLGLFPDVKGDVFKPNVKLTREEACVMLNSILKKAGVSLHPYKTVTFSDEDQISPQALNDVLLFANSGLIHTPDNRFEPKELATFEDVCVIVQKILKGVGVSRPTVTKTVRFYYPNADASRLIYLDKSIKVTSSLSLSDQTTFIALADGLKENGGNTHQAVLQQETVINGIRLDKNAKTVYVDISGDILNYNVGSVTERYIIDAIAMTFMDFYEVDHVMLTVDGRIYESGHILMEPGETLDRQNMEYFN